MCDIWGVKSGVTFISVPLIFRAKSTAVSGTDEALLSNQKSSPVRILISLQVEWSIFGLDLFVILIMCFGAGISMLFHSFH